MRLIDWTPADADRPHGGSGGGGGDTLSALLVVVVVAVATVLACQVVRGSVCALSYAAQAC